MPTEIPADPNTNPRRYSRFWFRFFEILPGATIWIALIAPFIFAAFLPIWVTVFVIMFDVYWLMRSLSYGDILLRGYARLKKNINTDWLKKLESLDELTEEDRKRLKIPDWRSLYHAIILATYKESQAILESSIDSIATSAYPLDHVIVVLATEERDAENARIIGGNLKKKYGTLFKEFIVTEHPDGIFGEVKAKGANVTWAARQLERRVSELGLPLENILVSTADADSRFHPGYLPSLSYNYVTTPDRNRACYQPVPMYFNNIWNTSMISRVLAFGSTFWQIIESVRDYRLVTFSTHSTSLITLKETNYWATGIVNEDSRQFFRAYFHYNGDFRVVPLFMPIYLDAVYLKSHRATLKSLYLQQQRWAYGVEHFPYIVLECMRHPKIPFYARFGLIFRAFAGGFTWATAAFFLTFVGWLPILLNGSFQDHVAASYFPIVTQIIISITWIGLLISGIITIKLLNTMDHHKRPFDFLTMILQWVMLPITSIFFGALPGIDAQSRLMLGKYMGFRVTEKAPVTPHDEKELAHA